MTDFQEFRRLFWDARRAHVKAGKKATDQSPEHQAALGYAKGHDLPWAEALLQASLLIEQDKPDDALAALAAAESIVPASEQGIVWHLRGVALADKKDYDGAIEAYRKALEQPGDFPSAWPMINLALVYEETENYKEARKILTRLIDDPTHDETYRSYAKSLLAVIDADMDKEALTPEDRALLEPRTRPPGELTPEERILAKIRGVKETQYQRYLAKPGSGRDNVLSILRGWSSSVTLLEGFEHMWRGGGYLIKWQGKGIVIDPGFDFLRNFHDLKYHGREIDAVLVSHNHSDHNADVKSIDDLMYELYMRRRDDKFGGIKPYGIFWDDDTHRSVKFSMKKPAHHKRPIRFDLGRCNPTDTIGRRHGLPFTVEYFKTRHGSDAENAVGFKLHLRIPGGNDFRFGFTGDTEFFSGLAKYLAGCDLLLAHISQPTEEELRNPSKRKKHHLGYRGLAALIEASKPRLTIVSEFWAGIADLRIDLVCALRKLTGNLNILPAGIGMHVHLPEMEIECTECTKRIPFNQVRVSPPAEPFGRLAYLCSQCLL